MIIHEEYKNEYSPYVVTLTDEEFKILESVAQWRKDRKHKKDDPIFLSRSQSKKLMEKLGMKFDPYACPYCGGCHLTKHQNPVSIIEKGD